MLVPGDENSEFDFRSLHSSLVYPGGAGGQALRLVPAYLRLAPAATAAASTA